MTTATINYVPADTTASVADLLLGIHDGDPASWDEILRRYGKLVSATVRTFRLQEADAVDAMQMTWLRLAENAHRVQFPERLGGWLATTARRECLHILRQRKLAKAAGRKWRINSAHAAMVVQQFFIPVIQTCEPGTFVNAEKAADLQATYQMHLRGDGRINFVFDDGSLRVEEPSARWVDCHILADPAAFFMVFWQRQSQWNAIAKGQLIAWGRKPWLGLKFRSLIRNP